MSSPIHNTNLHWLPIDTAPDLARVWVTGWQSRQGNCQGYWWWHEDTVIDGKAIEHPEALYWAPIYLPHPLPSLEGIAA